MGSAKRSVVLSAACPTSYGVSRPAAKPLFTPWPRKGRLHHKHGNYHKNIRKSQAPINMVKYVNVRFKCCIAAIHKTG